MDFLRSYLDEEDIRMLLMSRYEGFTSSVIAAMFNLTEATVRQRVSRAAKKIKRVLKSLED